MPVFLEPVVAWIGEVLWPLILRFLGWIGVKQIALLIRDWIALFFADKVMKGMVGAFAVMVGLTAWAAFLAVFWTFGSWDELKTVFSTNPLSGFPSMAGALYLASNFFPFHLFFGLAIAYVQWRITMIHAAIILNRWMFILMSR